MDFDPSDWIRIFDAASRFASTLERVWPRKRQEPQPSNPEARPDDPPAEASDEQRLLRIRQLQLRIEALHTRQLALDVAVAFGAEHRFFKDELGREKYRELSRAAREEAQHWLAELESYQPWLEEKARQAPERRASTAS